MTDTDHHWMNARKKPVEVEFRGPYTDPTTVGTLEGDFDVDEDYIDEHGAFVIIRGVQGEVYPCAYDVFKETHDPVYGGICQCDDPTVARTLAKGTPAEKRFCECGRIVRDD